jgi:hypothetical protein
MTKPQCTPPIAPPKLHGNKGLPPAKNPPPMPKVVMPPPK